MHFLLHVEYYELYKKILSSFGMMKLAKVEQTISTSVNLEYAPVTTTKYSPVGKGPQKSMWTACQ